ncbi:DUF397 domain-containing protein [Solihabitans fulvus]|uniref:DUF397 domain-containing protein n=1 Tax=Solihabitans fulvus TaxID=1892852 RepID=A0A5B2XFW7_9PSEU|nr:DUF397 domain-containing protein [Solihabitans fulvus]KAA2261935.1 DUF397 domain-containing protein [Solihabitans fulvus]
MTTHAFTAARWIKSSRSAENGSCVEVSAVPGLAGVRDSKNADGPVLTFPAPAWRHFLDSLRTA